MHFHQIPIVLLLILPPLLVEGVNDKITNVVGGKDAGQMEIIDKKQHIVNNGEYPFICSVEKREKNLHVCGATIFRKDVVLTAAHCTEKYTAKDLQVRAGTYRRGGSKLDRFQLRLVQRILAHPQHRKIAKHDYDISIIWLEDNFILNKYVNILQLASDSHVEEMGTILGWGFDANHEHQRYLQKAELRIIPLKDCLPFFGGHENFKLTGRMMCALSPNQDQGPCKGDSGGPLIIYDERKPENSILVGIISWVLTKTVSVKVRAATVEYSTCDVGVPSVYTSIAVVRKWILCTI